MHFCSFEIASNKSFNFERSISSRAANGSSNNRIFGFVDMALAIEARIFMPPESCDGNLCQSDVLNPTTCSKCSMVSRFSLSLLKPRISRGSMTLCQTVRQGSNAGSWKTNEISSRVAFGIVLEMGCPRISVRPESASIKPAMTRSSVLLPQPLGPKRETICPDRTRNDRSLRTRCETPRD